jgi:hypothetical protein
MYHIQPWQMRDLTLGEYDQIRRDLTALERAAKETTGGG